MNDLKRQYIKKTKEGYIDSDEVKALESLFER